MDIEKRNNLISLLLSAIIIVLGYFLYHSIVDPYQEVIQREKITERVRTRLSNTRDALVRYEARKDEFPSSLDTLIHWVKTDSAMQSVADTLFKDPWKKEFNADSMIYSPRTGERFTYILNDTLRPSIYLLKDPNSKDRIGDTLKTTLLNAASWE